MNREAKRQFAIHLGKRLTELRKRQGMTQAEFARYLGVSQQTVFAYEVGDRSVPPFLLKRMTHALEVRIDVLLWGSLDQFPKDPKFSKANRVRLERLRQLSRPQRQFVNKVLDILLAYHGI
jgi:transcriptional regulator with XRE-family HTH domain